MTEIVICPQCKGRKTVIDRMSAVFTLGMSLLFKSDKDSGRERCPTCDGKGFLIFQDEIGKAKNL